MSWAGLGATDWVTNANALNAVNTGVFTLKAGQSIPNNSDFITKGEATTKLNINSIGGGVNDWPTKNQFVSAIVTAWRAKADTQYCVQDGTVNISMDFGTTLFDFGLSGMLVTFDNSITHHGSPVIANPYTWTHRTDSVAAPSMIEHQVTLFSETIDANGYIVYLVKLDASYNEVGPRYEAETVYGQTWTDIYVPSPIILSAGEMYGIYVYTPF